MAAPARRALAQILIVDDDELIRSSLARVLKLEGYRSASASNGDAALKWLRRNPAPCVILLDLMMPGMNGWEFSREKQNDPQLAPIPVVVISAHSELRQRAAEIQALEFLEKPIDLDALLAAVEKVC